MASAGGFLAQWGVLGPSTAELGRSFVFQQLGCLGVLELG